MIQFVRLSIRTFVCPQQLEFCSFLVFTVEIEEWHNVHFEYDTGENSALSESSFDQRCEGMQRMT